MIRPLRVWVAAGVMLIAAGVRVPAGAPEGELEREFAFLDAEAIAAEPAASATPRGDRIRGDGAADRGTATANRLQAANPRDAGSPER